MELSRKRERHYWHIWMQEIQEFQSTAIPPLRRPTSSDLRRNSGTPDDPLMNVLTFKNLTWTLRTYSPRAEDVTWRFFSSSPGVNLKANFPELIRCNRELTAQHFQLGILQHSTMTSADKTAQQEQGTPASPGGGGELAGAPLSTPGSSWARGFRPPVSIRGQKTPAQVLCHFSSKLGWVA